jgi:hypothetical protein
MTASMTVCHHTPSSRAICAIGRTFMPAWMQHSIAAPGQKTPGGKLITDLGPDPQTTLVILAPVPVLSPAQPHRPVERRQIPVLHRRTIVRHPGPRARDRHLDRFDREHQPSVSLYRFQDADAGQAEHHLSNAGSVANRRGPHLVAAVRKPQR